MNIDIVLWILLLWPILVVFGLAILTLLPCLGLYNLQQKILKMFNGENPLDNQFCKKFKQVSENAWKMAKHTRTIMLLLKRLCLQPKEEHSKKSNVDTEEIFTIEGRIHEVKHATFKNNRTIYFTIMLFYSSAFTAVFWTRFFYFYEYFDSIEGFDMNLFMYIWGYLAFFLPSCFIFMNNSISPANHLTVAEAAQYLTGSPECQCYVRVHCYHTWGSGDDVTTVTTFQTDITVPISRWMDRGKKIGKLGTKYIDIVS
jgi:hypothetical protein